ncbi:hypothetical protein ACHAPT_010217 [Fusarium lateritium]
MTVASTSAESDDGSAAKAESTGRVKAVTQTTTNTETWCNTMPSNVIDGLVKPSPIAVSTRNLLYNLHYTLSWCISPLDGMKGGRKNFYNVETGDYCDNVHEDSNISIEEFISWNPAVESDRALIMKYYYYCIGYRGVDID